MNGVSFRVDTGSGVSILAARTWRKWGRAEDELTRYWGWLCSVEGRALECLGRAKGYWGTISPWHTGSQCGLARVPCTSQTSLEREKNTWASICRALSAQSPR